MKRFMICYFGGDQAASKEEGQRQFARYQQWLSDLGDAAIEPMIPLRNTQTILPDRSTTKGSAAALSGYTVVQAASLEAAIGLAQDCPFLDVNGTLEVAELPTP